MARSKYPTPPTGHDLMAMFPPAPPNNFEMRPGNATCSDLFKHQERAFFAQAGKEIVRVRVEIDFPHGSVRSDLPLPVHNVRPIGCDWHYSPPGQSQPNLQPPVHQTTGLQTPPEDSTTPPTRNSKLERKARKPMPYAERSRAGKHTRRVIART
jgi:hypothetical protein